MYNYINILLLFYSISTYTNADDADYADLHGSPFLFSADIASGNMISFSTVCAMMALTPNRHKISFNRGNLLISEKALTTLVSSTINLMSPSGFHSPRIIL